MVWGPPSTCPEEDAHPLADSASGDPKTPVRVPATPLKGPVLEVMGSMESHRTRTPASVEGGGRDRTSSSSDDVSADSARGEGTPLSVRQILGLPASPPSAESTSPVSEEEWPSSHDGGKLSGMGSHQIMAQLLRALSEREEAKLRGPQPASQASKTLPLRLTLLQGKMPPNVDIRRLRLFEYAHLYLLPASTPAPLTANLFRSGGVAPSTRPSFVSSYFAPLKGQSHRRPAAAFTRGLNRLQQQQQEQKLRQARPRSVPAIKERGSVLTTPAAPLITSSPSVDNGDTPPPAPVPERMLTWQGHPKLPASKSAFVVVSSWKLSSLDLLSPCLSHPLYSSPPQCWTSWTPLDCPATSLCCCSSIS